MAQDQRQQASVEGKIISRIGIVSVHVMLEPLLCCITSIYIIGYICTSHIEDTKELLHNYSVKEIWITHGD